MIIEDNVLAISNCIFKNKDNWIYVTDVQKKKFFFIFLRYMSKKYPSEAQFLNDKLIDEILGMNLIYVFLSTKPYPKWFWSKNEKKLEKEKFLFSEKDLLFLQKKLDLTTDELNMLVTYHFDEVKEEIKYYSDLEKIN